MFTIIGSDGKEYGPVSADQVRAWIAAGRANLETQARRVDTAEWKRLRDFAEFGTDGGAPPPLGATVVTTVPTPQTGPVDAKAFAADLIARAPLLDPIDCLGRAFELWKTHLLPLVGVTLLVLLAQSLAGLIPIVGLLSGLLLKGVFYGGLYYYYLGLKRGQRREVGDAFAGFTKAFVPLMLATIFVTLLSLAIALPFFAPWIVFAVKVMLNGINHGVTFPTPNAWMILLTLAGLPVIIYITTAWSFTFLLVIDQGLSPWTAMEVSRRVVSHQWFRVFLVILLGGIIAALGIIGLIIGIVFTLPLAFASVVCAYESLCNPPRAATPAAPTTPTSGSV